MPNKACKFRLYPTPAQKILLAKTFGCARLVYNHWLDRKISQYKEDQTALSYTFCAKELAVLKKTEEYAFLK
ncbi:helix-turn-helix domain-containing protein, partial [uncultured Dubosiella sp.]|uniref:helix-turn-helix domain-containing protein n=1 Tax=uncultured Dubosiella sp. TaxID=1937011 RepID=UPI002632BCD4